MAEIKGISLKNVTSFKGHEGEPCKQGSIYCEGKKVGYYSDSFMMGCATIDFDNDEIEKAVKEKCTEFYKEYPEKLMLDDYTLTPDLELFFGELIALIDYEKQYKKCVKQGFPVFATYKKKNGVEEMVGYRTKEYADQEIAKLDGISNLKFYNEPEDFIIK